MCITTSKVNPTPFLVLTVRIRVLNASGIAL